MKQIAHANQDVLNSFGSEWVKNNPSLYKKNKYTHIQQIDDGYAYLVYNIMTGELIRLSKEEFESYEKDTLNTEFPFLYHYMIMHFFLLRSHMDERTMVDTIRGKRKNTNKLLNHYLSRYVVYTTTGCNARCPYCYEYGIKKETMTEETASDIADFMIAHYDKNNKRGIDISWFGGEPLLNTKVIDVICNKLKEANVPYRTRTTTNGYYFTEEVIDAAINRWNLNSAQITIDGTQDMYNKIKGYVNDDPNPFNTVMQNIENCLNTGKIRISIRINMDMVNVNDMEDLAKYICDRFGNREKFGVYMALYFEKDVPYELNHTNEEKMMLVQKKSEIEGYYEKHGILGDKTFGVKYSEGHCLSDDPSNAIIYCDGRLGLCEHYYEEPHSFTTIYSDPRDIDLDYLRYWQFDKYECELCKDCIMYPVCNKSTQCPGEQECNEYYLYDFKNTMKWEVSKRYKQYLQNEKNIDQIGEDIKL